MTVLNQRELVVLYEALGTVDPDVLSDNLEIDNHPAPAKGEVLSLLSKLLMMQGEQEVSLQAPKGADPELVDAWKDLSEVLGLEEAPEPYLDWVEGQIDNHEQIWRESARSQDRDSTEQYLQVLRRELEKFS